MKSIVLASAIAIAASTAAFADDFDNNEFIATLASGNLEFSLGTRGSELATMTTGAYLTDHQLGAFDVYTFVSLGYDRLSSEVTLGGEVGASTEVNPTITVYGAANLDYVTLSNDLGAGDWSLTPSVGASFNLAETVSAFGEVGYSWSVSNDWASEGGYVEVGAGIGLTDSLLLVPSIVRTFDTANDETNARVELVLSF